MTFAPLGDTANQPRRLRALYSGLELPVVVAVDVDRPSAQGHLAAAVLPGQPSDHLGVDAQELRLLPGGDGQGRPGLRARVRAVRLGRGRLVAVGAVQHATLTVGDDDAERAGLHGVELELARTHAGHAAVAGVATLSGLACGVLERDRGGGRCGRCGRGGGSARATRRGQAERGRADRGAEQAHSGPGGRGCTAATVGRTVTSRLRS